jgi:polyisoprenoid-binding protein YceI
MITPDDALFVIAGDSASTFNSLSGVWEIDPMHSSVQFIARYARFTRIRGGFERFGGLVTMDGANPHTTTITMSIESASVNSGFALRDTHLRAVDFFDSETFPNLTFASTAVEPGELGLYVLRGSLTMKDRAFPVSLNVTFAGGSPDQMGHERLGFLASTQVSRSQWGLDWNAPLTGGGMLLDDNVDLEFSISLLPAGTIARMMAQRDQSSS